MHEGIHYVSDYQQVTKQVGHLFRSRADAFRGLFGQPVKILVAVLTFALL